MLSRVEREQKEKISAACFQELQTCGLLKNYSLWQTKWNGCLEGVVLLGNSKGQPKKTYAKKFRVFGKNRNTELSEFLAMSALQACGIPTPKAKIKPINDCEIYQLARDIAECHKTAANAAPVFYTLEELASKDCPFQLGKDKTTVEYTPEGANAKQSIVIDKASIAKLILSVLIFDLVDMHGENVGVLIDVKTGTAKLATVDLQLRTYGADRPDYDEHTSITSLIRCHKSIKEDFEAISLDQLDDSDYLKALEEITASMKGACDTAKRASITCNLSTWLDDNYINKMLTSWQTNHDELQLFTLLKCSAQSGCRK